MKRVERQKVEREIDVVIEHKCDVCKCDIVEVNNRNDEVEVSCKETEYFYSNDFNTDKISYDLCTKCFKEHIVGMFNKMGVLGKEESWS